MTDRNLRVLKQDGNFRICLVPDDEAESPSDECEATPILKYKFTPDGVLVEAFNPQGEPYVDQLKRSAQAFPGAHEIILHDFTAAVGSTEAANMGPDDAPTDGFFYISFCPPEWREHRGLADSDGAGAEAFLEDVTAWLNGDMWGWRMEGLVGPDWRMVDEGFGFSNEDDATEIALSNYGLLLPREENRR